MATNRKNGFGPLKFFSKSIARKLFLLVAAASILPALAVAYSMYVSTSNGIFDKSFDQLEVRPDRKSNPYF